MSECNKKGVLLVTILQCNLTKVVTELKYMWSEAGTINLKFYINCD